jgi:SNF2 family DNA or RNA helicase
MFPGLRHFELNHVDYYWNGKGYKAGGIKYPERFLEKTKDFIIRRTRKEVLPDLPSISRDYKYYPISDKVKLAYGKRVRELSTFLDEERGNDFQVNLIAMLGILRHLTGLAKIEPVLEYTLDFIENDENSPKIVIFHHHIDVGDIIENKLLESKVGILRIKSSQDAGTRQDQIDEFKSNPLKQVLLIPTLAGGEGINLQFCSHAIIMEREWNPANEEQAEGRFSRIGSEASHIQVVYPVATGTIDEYFAEIVERKREIVGVTLDGYSPTTWDNSSIMLDLAEKVVNKWRF